MSRPVLRDKSDPGVSEQPGQEVAGPSGAVPPAAAAQPAAESPGVATAPEPSESEPQSQPVAQEPTKDIPTPEKPCLTEVAPEKSCLPELENPCLTDKDAVDSGAELEIPALAEAGTGVQSSRSEAPVTTPGDGGDVEMEDEPMFKEQAEKTR